MLEQMMSYLKMKQDIVNRVDWSKECSTDEKTINWLKQVMKIDLAETAFLTVTPEIYEHLNSQLTKIGYNVKPEIQKTLAQFSCYLSKVKNNGHRSNHLHDDYYQWMTLVRTKPNYLELSQKEMLRQSALDYDNMQALINQENLKLVGNYDFLTTVNFTMTMFTSVYLEQPSLLNQAREVVEQGLLVNHNRDFQKLAKRTMKRIDNKEKLLTEAKQNKLK